MLQAIRDKTSGLIAGIIFFFLILTLAVYALPGFFGGSFSTAVAEVGDEQISQSDWIDRFNQIRVDAQQRMGENFDPSVIDNPIFKRNVLDSMIDRILLRQDGTEAGIGISENRLKKQIAGIESFQQAGRFEQSLYEAWLTASRTSEDKLFADLRDDAASSEIRSALGQSMFVADAEIDRYVRLRDQQRSFRFVRLALADVPAPPEPTEDELKKYFDGHGSDFMTEEQLDVEYVEVKLADIPETALTDEELKAHFEKVKGNFLQPEERLASHVLIEVPVDADAEAQKAALAKAEDITKRARAGEKFEDLAKQLSNDAGSAEQGGDLGWLLPDSTEPAFDAALFKMEANTISDPVKSDQGYHVIQLREIRPERSKSFDEVKAELQAQLTQDRRLATYADRIGELNNERSRDPFQLSGPAEKLGLKLERTGLFPRSAPVALLANPLVSRELASDVVIERGQVTPVIKLDDTQALMLRVADRKKPEPRKFEDVREQIKALLVQQNHQKALKDKANEWLVKLRKDGKLDAMLEETKKTAESADAVVRTAMNFPAQVLTVVFKQPRPEKDSRRLTLAEISPQEFALVELSTVVDGDPTKLDAAARDSVREQLRSERSNAESEAYLAALRKAAEITIYEDRL